MSLTARRRTACLALAFATMAAGLIWRFALPGLSPFWFKYGGSALWAVMVYWFLAAAEPRRPTLVLASHAAAIALLVELVRLVHTPGLDAFRLTLAGRLLLGRIFSLYDIVAYWLAISVMAWVTAGPDTPNAAKWPEFPLFRFGPDGLHKKK